MSSFQCMGYTLTHSQLTHPRLPHLEMPRPLSVEDGQRGTSLLPNPGGPVARIRARGAARETVAGGWRPPAVRSQGERTGGVVARRTGTDRPVRAGVLQPLMRPRFGNNDMYGAEVPFRQLEADARMLTARLAALAAAVLVGIGAVAWKLVALI